MKKLKPMCWKTFYLKPFQPYSTKTLI